ncbi:Fe-S cluster assembly protein SufD [Clostridiales bacterium COT073_COT-073]|nr:Fe-S cluster assembly protein SufD [Clostridiales bacterium COT073_COT-073]
MGNYVKYRARAKEHFEALPYPAWKRIGFSDYAEPVIGREEVKVEIHSELPLVGAENLTPEQAQAFYDRINQRTYGVNPKFVAFSESQSNFSKLYYVKRNQVVEKPIHIRFDLSEISTLADEHLIYAEKGAEVSLILEYHADNLVREKASEYHIGLIKVIAEENAQVKVYVAQTLPESKVHIMNAVAECGRDARVSFYSVNLGAEVVASDYRSFLMGDYSSSDIEGIYLGEAENKLDLSYNIQHYGQMTDSMIEVNGALSGRAKKVFRGDLYFHRGSKASTGKEAEFVILLNQEVKADSIPALFCDEDDVSGEHAANAGTVDENKLFYLMNRGFSETEAKKLIIRASFSGVLDHLPSEELVQRLEKELEGKLIHV